MIQHVTQEVPPARLHMCIAFYEVLGFRQTPTPPGIVGRAVWLQSGATQIHLMPTEAGDPEAGTARRAGHVGVVVEAYEETIERLRAEGHSIDPRREHWGSPRAYVRDPAGNLVELMAWPPDGRRE